MINTQYILPILILFIILCALCKRINAYTSFIEGVKEGLGLFYNLFPALLAMMCAISLLRESGLLAMFSNWIVNRISFIPSDVIPMILFRPISGSASLAVLIDIFKTCGVDSIEGIMASVIQGSTDTTFYVITLYFSTVGIKKIKNSLSIGLLADLAGISMAILLTLIFFG
ncbi:MAG: spore maturation protein [Erysipelotrichaceae bacterium]|nr:spore maturation protein [Erysipelotrichaceae bacterium]